MDNTGKKSGIYGNMKDGVFSAFCELCHTRCPRYPADYPHEKKCINCGAILVPWEKRDVR